MGEQAEMVVGPGEFEATLVGWQRFTSGEWGRWVVGRCGGEDSRGDGMGAVSRTTA